MKTTRRAVIVAAAVGATGCIDGGDNGDSDDGDVNDTDEPENGTRTDEPGNETDGNTSEETEGQKDGTGDDEVSEPNRDEVKEYRKWLTDARLRENSNLRFEYTDGYTDVFVGGRVEPLDLSPENVEGHLTQSGRVVHLGDFDTETLVERVEETDSYETAGEYEGYTVVEGMVNGTTVELAFGEDAVVVGEGYEAPIDARLGNRERLEEVESDFTLLLDELPEGETIAGQYGAPPRSSPVGEYVSVWGVSHETQTGGETTWVYVFENADDVTPKRAGILASSIRIGDANDTETDGRVARVMGEVPVPDKGNVSD